MEDKIERKRTDKKKRINLNALIEYLLEYIAMFDFATDGVVMVQLFLSSNPGWAIVTTMAMFAPLLVT